MPPSCISLSEVSHKNVVYSDAEEIVIKNGLKITETSLLRLNTLRSNGAAQRQQFEDYIRRCQVALAPVKKIPSEIWMCIFELYCQSGQLSTCGTEQDSAVVLTLVCSAWQQIALSTPKLWSDVHLDEKFSPTLARMWLERAGNVPRALETSVLPSHYSSSIRLQAIQTFVCSFPFRKLHLHQCDAAIMDFMEIPIELLLPLEDLALKPASNNISMYLEIYLSPHHFPNCTSLQIYTNKMPFFHVSRPFATWKKLRVLRLECERLAEAQYREILRDASSVEDCSLRLTLTSFYAQDSTVENTILANLKILRLSFPFTYVLWSFLYHFTFPNLHTLILNLSPNYDSFQPSDRSPLLRHAPRFGSLRSLKFHHSCTDVDVGLVLKYLPLLQVLELHCAKITTDIGKKIGRGLLGGCLRELRDWSTNNLLGFLQACELRRDTTTRQSPNSPGAVASLEKVSVRVSDKKRNLACKQRIRKLCKNGIQFELF